MRSPSRGKSAVTSAMVLLHRLRVAMNVRAELEVLAHREAREDRAALGRERDAVGHEILGRSSAVGLPAKVMVPLVSGKRPITLFSVVVLPAPFAPMMATISPGNTSRLIPLSALMPPYATRRSVSSRSGVPSGSVSLGRVG